eukprot:8180932-Pyramimonas_sp.AAC.2
MRNRRARDRMMARGRRARRRRSRTRGRRRKRRMRRMRRRTRMMRTKKRGIRNWDGTLGEVHWRGSRDEGEDVG